MPSKAKATFTTDHDEIRRWAEERGAKPACVRGTGDPHDIGILRLDFPGYTGEDKLQPIDWDDWFEKFDERGLALLHQETTAKGQKSNFNKLVSRETAEEAGNQESARQTSATKARSTEKSASQGKAASSNARRSSQTTPAQKQKKKVTNISRKQEGTKPSPHTRPSGGRAA